MLTFHSASMGAVNTNRAVAECLEIAHGGTHIDCDLIVFHTSLGHDFKKIVREMGRLAPGARIVGCTGGGVIGREGPNETMRGLAGVAIHGTKDDYAIAGINCIAGVDSRDIGETIADKLKEQNPRIHTVLFYPAFPHVFPIERSIEGIETVFGSDIQITGGISFHGGEATVTNFQFLDEEIFEQGAVAVGIADSSLEPIMDSDQDCTVIGRPFTVTRARRNRVYELDGKPAWTALTEQAGLPEDIHPFAREAFPLWAQAVPLPEEIAALTKTNHHAIFGGPLGTDDGSRVVGVSVAEGSPLWMTLRDEDRIFDGADRIAKNIVDRSGGRTPVAVFHADCQMRGRYSFNRILKGELIDRIQFPLCGDDTVPWLGFYCGGEFSRLGPYNIGQFYTSTICGLYRRRNESCAETN